MEKERTECAGASVEPLEEWCLNPLLAQRDEKGSALDGDTRTQKKKKKGGGHWKNVDLPFSFFQNLRLPLVTIVSRNV